MFSSSGVIIFCLCHHLMTLVVLSKSGRGSMRPLSSWNKEHKCCTSVMKRREFNMFKYKMHSYAYTHI